MNVTEEKNKEVKKETKEGKWTRREDRDCEERSIQKQQESKEI